MCKIHMAAILKSKMAAYWTESNSRRKWIDIHDIRHIWAIFVTCNLQMSQNQWFPYIPVCKIHMGTAAILNFKMAAFNLIINFRNEWTVFLASGKMFSHIYELSRKLLTTDNDQKCISVWRPFWNSKWRLKTWSKKMEPKFFGFSTL